MFGNLQSESWVFCQTKIFKPTIGYQTTAGGEWSTSRLPLSVLFSLIQQRGSEKGLVIIFKTGGMSASQR